MVQSRTGTMNSSFATQEVIFVDEEGNQIEGGAESLIYVDVNGEEIPEDIALEMLKSGDYIDSRELFQTNDTASIASQPTTTQNINNTYSNASISKLNPEIEIKSEIKNGTSSVKSNKSSGSLSRRHQQPPPQKPVEDKLVNISQGSLIPNKIETVPLKLQADIEQQDFQKKILELQNLIQEKQAELEINLAKSVSVKSNQNTAAVVAEQPVTLAIHPGHSVGKQSSAFTIVKQQITKEKSIETLPVVEVAKVPSATLVKAPSVKSVEIVKVPSVVAPVEIVKASSVASVKAEIVKAPSSVVVAEAPVVKVSSVVAVVKAPSIAEIVKVPSVVVVTPVEVIKTPSVASVKVAELVKEPSIASVKADLVKGPSAVVVSQTPVELTKAASTASVNTASELILKALASAPLEIVKVPSVVSAPVEIVKTPSVAQVAKVPSTQVVTEVVKTPSVPSVRSVELIKEPSVKALASPVKTPQIDDISKMILNAFPLGIQVALPPSYEPIYQKQSRSSSQIKVPVKSSSTIKSQGNIAENISVSSVKPVEKAPKSSDSSRLNIPAGYILAEPKYIGNLDPANGVTLDYLQNLINQHASKIDQFPDTHLEDIEYNKFIDPFTSSLFQDEIIEIDYGAIDAFTAAFNSSEPNATGAQPNLKVSSHILDGKFSSFVDNQLLLGDYIDASLEFTSFDAFNQEYQLRNLSNVTQKSSSKVY